MCFCVICAKLLAFGFLYDVFFRLMYIFIYYYIILYSVVYHFGMHVCERCYKNTNYYYINHLTYYVVR